MNFRPNTAFLLMAQYGAASVIPLTKVVPDYFPHLSVEKFLQKVRKREIVIPVVQIEASTKGSRGIPLNDLADYIDRQIERARKEIA